MLLKFEYLKYIFWLMKSIGKKNCFYKRSLTKNKSNSWSGRNFWSTIFVCKIQLGRNFRPAIFNKMNNFEVLKEQLSLHIVLELAKALLIGLHTKYSSWQSPTSLWWQFMKMKGWSTNHGNHSTLSTDSPSPEGIILTTFHSPQSLIDLNFRVFACTLS